MVRQNPASRPNILFIMRIYAEPEDQDVVRDLKEQLHQEQLHRLRVELGDTTSPWPEEARGA